jgi:hypothetical protein
MSINEENNISLTGLDWSNQLREVDVDLHLWYKMCGWRGGEENALKWLQLQIKLFSERHPGKASLSYIISSIAFVEMSNPSRAQNPERAKNSDQQQPAMRDAYQLMYGNSKI